MTLHTSILTLTPPSGDLYAAVQVEDADGRVLGAAPAFTLAERATGRMLTAADGEQYPETEQIMVPARSVAVTVKPGDPHIALWVHEDSTRGITEAPIIGRRHEGRLR